MSTLSQEVPRTPPDLETSSVADLLLRAAQGHKSSGVYIMPERSEDEATFLTYPGLLSEAERILTGLRPKAGNPGARIALLLERPSDFIPAFWACILGGYVPCPLAPIRNDQARWEKHLSHVDTLLGGPLFVSAGTLLHELPASLASADLASLPTEKSQKSLHQVQFPDAAVLMLTSGSTGNSKAVELTHANILASMAGRAKRQKLTSADVMFNWIAFDHVAALLESHLIAVYVGATQLHAEPTMLLSDPLKFLSLIHKYRVSVAFAPNFFLGQINALLQEESQSRFEEAPALRADLTCLRRIVTGGEANVVETGRRFLNQLSSYGLNRAALWPAFGMTETCAACVYSDEFPDCDVNREFASVGLPIEGLEVRIMNEQSLLAHKEEAGELQLRGPMIFRRYYNNEEATRAAFTEDGWFRTGDVGRIDGGRLSLVARSKDSIIVNGVNYFSHELETRLEQLDGIERSYVAAFPTRPKEADTEGLVVTFATTLKPEDERSLYQLVVAVRDTTIMLWGFRPTLILPLPKTAFPKTSLGKTQRSLMRKRLEAGDLEADIVRIAEITRRQTGPYIAPEGPLEEGLVKLFSEILRVDLSRLSVSANFFDLGGTSLDILKLAQSLQRRFGLNVTLPVILQNPTVRDLATRVTSQDRNQSTKYDPIILLQRTGRKTPLFCVHPGNGEIFVLVNVAKYFLHDRPFYALRPRGFNESEQCFATIQELVSTYVDAVLERQSKGPYAIAGYSLGCPIAFEIARELEARGNEVAFLGCIDFYPCYEVASLEFNMATGLALVLDLINREQFEELNRRLDRDLPNDAVCKDVLSYASPSRLTELDLDLHKFSVWARVAYRMETLLFRHLTSGKVKTMTVFCGEGISPRYTTTVWSRQTWRVQLRRWDEFVIQPKYIDVAGDHHSIIGPKHVATFQATLRSEIDLALQGR